MKREINGREVALSEAGWLDNPAEWNDEIAALIAENESVTMTPEHWEVVRTTRAYYDEYGMNAEVRVFLKLMKEKYGAERATNQYIYGLFPYGLVKSANKIAGLPRPKGCS